MLLPILISLSTHQFFQTESQKPVLSFLEQFFSSSTVVSVAKANVLETPTIAVFPRNWFGAEPNFAPFRWCIWLAPRQFLCLLANQNVTFVTLFCTQLPFFCTVLPKNFIALSQSQSRNFFMYITFWSLVFSQGAHTICVCNRLLFESKCTGCAVCFTYSDTSLSMYTYQC